MEVPVCGSAFSSARCSGRLHVLKPGLRVVVQVQIAQLRLSMQCMEQKRSRGVVNVFRQGSPSASLDEQHA